MRVTLPTGPELAVHLTNSPHLILTMAIARVATEYVFSDFLLKEQSESKYKGVRLELATDKLVSFIAVGLPLLLISLAFAQEVSVGQ